MFKIIEHNRANREQFLDTAFVFACALVAFLLPFSIRLTTKAIIVMALVWLFQNNFSRLADAIKINKLFWLLSSLYLLMVIALIYTKDFKLGLWHLEKGSALLIFPILFASARPLSSEQIYFIVKAFILSNISFGVVSLLYATYVYLDQGLNIFFYHDLVMPLFQSHATYSSIYFIFSVVGVLVLYGRANNPTAITKILLATLIIFFSVLVYLLSVRSIIILYSLSAATAILVYTFKFKKLKVGAAMLVAFITLVLVIGRSNQLLMERLSQVFENYEYEMSPETVEGYNGLTTRLAQWESSLSIMKKHPILGVSPADVQDELQEMYKKNHLKYSYQNRWNAHNQYIQTTLGLGFVGLAAFVMGLFITGNLAYRQRNILVLAFVVLFAYCSITESTLYVQKGIVFYSFFQSLFVFHMLNNRVSE